MNTNTINGTYGSDETPCQIFTYTQSNETWYVVEGSRNVNCTFFPLQDGIDVELISDHNTASSNTDIDSEEELMAFMDDEEDFYTLALDSWINGNKAQMINYLDCADFSYGDFIKLLSAQMVDDNTILKISIYLVDQ